MGVAAASTSTADLKRLNRLAELGRLPGGMQARYLATALESLPAARFKVQPYAILGVRPQRGGDEIKVGVLSLNGPAEAEGLVQAGDPTEALRRHIPEVDSQSDIVLLLTRMPDESLYRTASLFPAVDVVVNGSSGGEGRDLGRRGNAVIVESAHAGVAVGMLEVEWDARGHITKHRNQQIPLPPAVADEPSMVELIDAARREASAFAEEEARRSPAVAAPLMYAGARACMDCHEKAYRVWEKSRHAHAIETLKKAGNHYNKECLPCHVTGFGVERGFVNMLRTPQLANIQCEACHDASKDHAADPQNVRTGIGLAQQLRHKVAKSFCLRCHTPENSPKFSYDTYWGRIAH